MPGTKRFKDFIVDVAQPENAALLQKFYSIVAKPDYLNSELRDFFSQTNYTPTRKEYDKINELHGTFEEMFDFEYTDY